MKTEQKHIEVCADWGGLDAKILGVLRAMTMRGREIFSFQYDQTWFPIPRGEGFKLNVSETDNSQDLELAKNVAEHFRLSTKQADLIIQQIVISVKKWQDVANSHGISAGEQNKMKNAFRLAGS